MYHPDLSKFVLEVLRSVREVEQGVRDKPSQPVIPEDKPEVLLGGETSALPAPPPAPALSVAGSVKPLGVVSPPVPPLSASGASGSLAEGFLEWGVRYALENLARAQDNDVFPEMMEQLQVRCVFFFFFFVQDFFFSGGGGGPLYLRCRRLGLLDPFLS